LTGSGTNRPHALKELDECHLRLRQAQDANAFLDASGLRAMRMRLQAGEWRGALLRALADSCEGASEWDREVAALWDLAAMADEFDKLWSGEEKTFGRGSAFGLAMTGGGFLAAVGTASVIGAMAFVVVGLAVAISCEGNARRRVRAAAVCAQIAREAGALAAWIEARRPDRLKAA
jgi:hypothetical protein